MKQKTNILNEWYFPDNFDNLPDVITLYHGTDYYSLTDILESGVIDARKGKRTGETKNMNWFFVEYKKNFSRGFTFSIDIHKSEINKTTDGFKYMNDGAIVNYEPIDISTHNFKIIEAFDRDEQMLKNIWNYSQKKNPDDEYEAMCAFADYFYNHTDYDATINDTIIQQLIAQFIGKDKLCHYGIIESIETESPDMAYSNKGENKWTDYDAIPFIIDKDFESCFIGDNGETHGSITYWDTEKQKKLYVVDDLGLYRHNSWQGRLWVDDKLISLWFRPSPEELKQIIEELSYHIDINFFDWYIDIGFRTPISVKDYIEGKSPYGLGKQFDTNVLHLKKGEDKVKDPQMQAYLKNRNTNQSNKLGKPNNSREVTRAEYNHYKRYGMGECIHTINEVDSDDINLDSFEVQDELHPKFWINNKLNSRVRLRLLDIADDFIDTLAVDWVKPEDIVFTGSLANYNWSKYSDIDVHVILDYNKVYKKKEFVEDYFSAKKELWLNEHPELKIYGYPIEMYVEDSNAESCSTGVYSLTKNKWLKEPADFQDVTLNEKYIKNYAAKIMSEIDVIEKKQKSTKDEHMIETCQKKLKKIFDKVKKMRKESLSKQGEMSSGNIIFKILRRTNYIDKIWDLVNSSYDKINSIKENKNCF